MSDGVSVVEYVLSRVGRGTAVILWGHSLGSGVVTRVAGDLCADGRCPDGLVLHAGYTTLPQVGP